MLNDKTADYWKQIAQHDIDTFSLLIKEKGHPDIIIYHIHQAIEKIIKSKIIENNGTFPYIHKLTRLYQILCSLNEEFNGIFEQIMKIEAFSNNLRYPQSDFLNLSSQQEALDAYNTICKNLNF